MSSPKFETVPMSPTEVKALFEAAAPAAAGTAARTPESEPGPEMERNARMFTGMSLDTLNRAAGGGSVEDDARNFVSASPDDLSRWDKWFRALKDKINVGSCVALGRLFPHTDPEDFVRWTRMRSARADDAGEPLLADDGRRTLFPLADPEAFEFRKRVEKLHWVAHSVRMDKEAKDFERLDPAYRTLIERVLGFFGMSDEGVLEGLDEYYTARIKRKEAQHYLRAVAEQESVHSEAYSIQIEAIVPAARQSEVFDAVETMPAVGQMADWMRFWSAGEHSLADRLLASAHVEGVMFSAQFAIIQNTKGMNLLDGLTTYNEYIARDENVHTQFWCFLLRERLVRRPDAAVAAAIAREVVRLCEAFIDEAIPEPTGGLTATLLKDHVRSVSDNVSVLSGYARLYDVASPFRFMDNLVLNSVGKTNFFEAEVSQYQAPEVGAYEFAVLDTPIEGR